MTVTDGVVELLIGLALTWLALCDGRADGLEERDVVANPQRVLVWHCQRKRLREFCHGPQQPLLAIFLGQDVLLRRWEERQSILGSAREPRTPVEHMEEAEADFVLLQDERHCLGLIERGQCMWPALSYVLSPSSCAM